MKVEEIFENKYIGIAKAVLNNDLIVINQTVQEGLDINKIFQDNITLLLWGMINDKELAVRELLKLGANPNLKDSENIQPIYYAVIDEDNSIYLKILLEYKADPNGSSGGHTTVLHDAFIKEFWGNVNLLLEYGANINTTDRDGNTIALKCAYLNWFQDLNSLILRGARIDVETENGRGGIPLQVQESHVDIEEFVEAQSKSKQLMIENGIVFPVVRPYEVPFINLRNQWYQTPIGKEWKDRLENIGKDPRGFGKVWTDAKIAENASLRMWMQENNIPEPVKIY